MYKGLFYNKTVELEDFLLREFCIDDAEDFYEYAKVEGVGEAAGWKHHEDIQRSKDVIEIFNKEHDVFAIYSKKDKKVIGSIGLHFCSDENGIKTYELGYVLSKNYWKRGIMTLIAKRVLDYAFNECKIDVIEVSCNTSNIASKRVIEKIGFKGDPTVKETKTSDGGIIESYIYKMTCDEYKKGCKI